MPNTETTDTQTTAPLHALSIAPENARGDRAPENVETLADNIARYDLISPLIVYADNEARGFFVADGRRRLAALLKLAERDDVPAPIAGTLQAVPISVRPREDALAVSLSANTQRVDLHPADAARAFAKMLDDGAREDEVAKAFGVTARFVAGRVKLARLHPPILEALARDEIGLDLAQLYAGAEPARQEAAWTQTGGADAHEHEVKKILHRKTLGASDALAKFIGEEAYVAAGGRVAQELFGEPSEARWLDPKIADKVAGEKLEIARAALEAEGWSFVHVATKRPPWNAFVDGAQLKKRALFEAEKEREKQLQDEQKQLNKKMEALEERDDFSWNDPEVRAIEARLDELDAALEALDAAREIFDDAAKKKTGAVAWINDKGVLEIERGQVVPKPKGDAKTGATKKTDATAARAEPPPEPELDANTFGVLTATTGRIIGRALSRKPVLAIAIVAAEFARHHLQGGEGVLSVEAYPLERANRLALLSDARHADEAKAWKARLKGKWADAETEIAGWPLEEQCALLAFCVGDLIQTECWIESDLDLDTRKQVQALAKLAGVNPADDFAVEAKTLEGYSLDALERFGKDLGLVGLPAGKKGLAAAIAAAARDKGWVPPIVATLCGVTQKSTKTTTTKTGATKKAKPNAATNAGLADAAHALHSDHGEAAAKILDAPKKRGRPKGSKTQKVAATAEAQP